MRIKTEWLSWRRNFRKREFDLIFSKCPRRLFQTGLELGGGDGFQSTLLTEYVSKLICTDLSPDRLKRESSQSIEYRMCDAEEVDKTFGKRQFDLVYSSNLLEHLPNPDRALTGINEVLKDDGITIHVMPSPFWKLCHLLFHVPNLFAIALEKTTEKDGLTWMLRKMRGSSYNWERNGDELRLENNPKTQRDPRGFMRRLLVPEPHGVSDSNIKEFYTFSKSRWKKEFEEANLDLVRIIKGPVASGYGFGFDRIRSVLERLGFTSEYVYIAAKKGKICHYLRFF